MMSPTVAAVARQLVTPALPSQTVARCLSLLKSGRIQEAGSLIASLSGATGQEQAWKSYLQARLYAEQGDFGSAKSLAQRSAGRALQEAIPASAALMMSLASAGLELEGLALRRLDQPEKAKRLHVAAYGLRTEVNALAGQCESAASIGLCAQQIGEVEESDRWLTKASQVECADRQTATKKASALVCLAALQLQRSLLSDGIEAARAAQRLLASFLPGELVSASAQLCVTHASLRQGEQLLSEGNPSARTMLDELVGTLESIHDELLAFGPAAHLDVELCAEQLDFARQLRAFAADAGLEPIEF